MTSLYHPEQYRQGTADWYRALWYESKEQNMKLEAALKDKTKLLEEDPLQKDIREAEERKRERDTTRNAQKRHRGYLAKTTGIVAFAMDALGIPFVWAGNQPHWEVPTIATALFCTFGLGALAAIIAEIVWITTGLTGDRAKR